ncbi:MAG: tRNA (guanosine(37)-N1)-methyltransferase TrmD [Coriobacteriia bacterium]|nr:tRNA (guanosine(37)-N1)-methyltransferase TrmD [Coriobacteriia bacterium]
MRVDVLTIFPSMFAPVLGESMTGIAQERGFLDLHVHDLRDWTHDLHRTVDDAPYGGGPGMVMKCEPIFEAIEAISKMAPVPPHIIFLAPIGTPFAHAAARELSHHERILLVCGRYEGFDERVLTLADEIISIGDYVMSGGELGAMVIVDAVTRLIPGVLGDAESTVDESFVDGLLEYPHYTRPAEFRGMSVPDVLLSGDHAKIERWRREQSWERTTQLRPDLVSSGAANLTKEGSEKGATSER